MIIINRNQYHLKASEIDIKSLVDAGSVDLSSNISNNLGTIAVIITATTPITTTIINIGYIIADLIFHVNDSTFSICEAKSDNTLFSCHVFSHDLIIHISASEKLAGYSSKHSDKFFHSLSSSPNLHSICLNTGFFSCFSNTIIDFINVIQAFVIVDKRR
ncbi:hypothetical protein HOA93_04895 [bacterium]|jgi:hypothetical protein|nr:hypothetical protein [bacterium]MBT6779077.1 hypothetical protein [bacterium]